jgi:hypothetical protein
MNVVMEKSKVISDVEILKKIEESENNYKETGISYSFEESYEK